LSGRYDVVLVGAGHNALTAAAYLARAGRSVLVLERSATIGGTAQTAEFAPGFRASSGFQSAETLSRAVIKELKLAAHGLSLSATKGVSLASAEGWLRFDGKGKLVGGGRGDGAGGAELLGDGDKRALRELERFLGRVVNVLAPLYDAPLPDVDDLGAGTKLDLLRVGWRLRRLGRRDMQAAMRFLPMSMRDVVEERFENPALQALVAGLGLQGGWRGPHAAGTAFRALHDQLSNPRPMMAGPAYVRGGMGALAAALAASARAAGAEIRTGAEVVRIEAERGAARGVTLASGDHVEAGVVVSGVDPRRTLLQLLDPSALTPEFVLAARGIRATAGVALVSFALDRLPHGPGGVGEAADVFAGRVQIGASVADLERAFDAAPAETLPERPTLQLFVPSISDPELAPEGRHVLTAWVQAVPMRLEAHAGDDRGGEDGWVTGRDVLADRVTGLIEDALPGFADHIVARAVAAPPDLEEQFAATGGCLFDVDLGLDQALYLRPLPGWSGYRTPVTGVYLCGSGCHGGGGITGLAGRNAARRVAEDLRSAASGRRD
jgi:phytoene dehydrogenase-like protein